MALLSGGRSRRHLSNRPPPEHVSAVTGNSVVEKTGAVGGMLGKVPLHLEGHPGPDRCLRSHNAAVPQKPDRVSRGFDGHVGAPLPMADGSGRVWRSPCATRQTSQSSVEVLLGGASPGVATAVNVFDGTPASMSRIGLAGDMVHGADLRVNDTT